MTGETAGSVGVVNIWKIIAISLLNVLHCFISEFDLEGNDQLVG